VGGDKAHETADIVAECRNLKVTPHVAQSLMNVMRVEFVHGERSRDRRVGGAPLLFFFAVECGRVGRGLVECRVEVRAGLRRTSSGRVFFVRTRATALAAKPCVAFATVPAV